MGLASRAGEQQCVDEQASNARSSTAPRARCKAWNDVGEGYVSESFSLTDGGDVGNR